MAALTAPYRALAVAGFRRYAVYRLATLAGAFTNSVFGLLRASVVTGAVAAGGGSIAGYDVPAAATYAFVTQALIAPVHVFSWSDVALRIRTGDIAIDLARPVDLQAQFLLADLGRAAYSVIPRGLPPLLVGVLTFGLALPDGALPYLAGTLSLTVAVAISFGCRYLVNLTAFWILDVRGPMNLYVVVMNVLGGLLLPLHWFPAWLATIAHSTPFPSMIQAPTDVFTGRVQGPDLLATLGLQLVWLVVVLALGRAVQAAATRTLVVQGG